MYDVTKKGGGWHGKMYNQDDIGVPARSPHQTPSDKLQQPHNKAVLQMEEPQSSALLTHNIAVLPFAVPSCCEALATCQTRREVA